MSIMQAAIGAMIPKFIIPTTKVIERFEALGLSEIEQTYSETNFGPTGVGNLGDYDVSLSTSHVTNGTYSLRWQDAVSDSFQLTGKGFFKRAGDTLLKLDVYVQVPTGGQSLIFEIPSQSLIDSVSVSSSGLYTLELDVSSLANDTDYQSIHIRMTGGSYFTLDIYLDNMRVVRSGSDVVLWGFEQLPLDSFTGPWLTTQAGNIGLTNGDEYFGGGHDYLTAGSRVIVTRSTTGATQGTYSWKFENDGSTDMWLLSTVAKDLTDYVGGTLKIDYNVTVSTGAGITIEVYLIDVDGTYHSTCGIVALAGVSSGTLTAIFSSDVGFDPSAVRVEIDISVPEDGDIVYIDNLRIEP